MSLCLDEDVKKLIGWLLREHAEKNSDFQRYSNISSQLSFEVANRGLSALNLLPVPVQPKELKK